MNYNDFFALAENKGINRIQVTETYIKQNEIQFIDKNLEKYNISEHLDYYIKAERNNKTEKVRTDYLDESIIDLLIMKLDETDSNYEDDYLKKKKTMKLQEPDENDSSEELEKLSRIYKLKKISDKILKIESFYEEHSERIRIINNFGRRSLRKIRHCDDDNKLVYCHKSHLNFAFLIAPIIFAIISSGYETLATISQNYRLDVIPLNKRCS